MAKQDIFTLRKDRYSDVKEYFWGVEKTVYIARDEKYCSKVRIEEYRLRDIKAITSEERYLNRLYDKIDIAKKFNNSCFVSRLYEYFETEENIYIIKEYKENCKALREWAATKNPSIEESVGMAIKICEAVSNIIHEGILLDEFSNDSIIIDEKENVIFSVENMYYNDDRFSFLLDQRFCSPEMNYSFYSKADEKSLIYMIGVLLYWLLTRKYPENSEYSITRKILAPKEINDQITEHMSDIILKAMALKPNKRYSSIIEFKNVLSKRELIKNRFGIRRHITMY